MRNKILDKEAIEDRLYDISSAFEDLLYDIRNCKLIGNSEELEDCSSSALSEWKQKVIAALPEKASVKFRNDVEELLEKFKTVY